MSRDKWACRVCGDQDNQLHVHHLYYLPKLKIWEYDNESLVTLCWEHHEQITKELGKLSGIIAFEILRGNIDLFEFPDKYFFDYAGLD